MAIDIKQKNRIIHFFIFPSFGALRLFKLSKLQTDFQNITLCYGLEKGGDSVKSPDCLLKFALKRVGDFIYFIYFSFD